MESLQYQVEHTGRVNMTAYKAANGVMFALAMTAAMFRMATRFRMSRRLMLDDYLLLVGVVTLIGAVVVIFWAIQSTYVVEAVSLDPMVGMRLLSEEENSGARLINTVQLFETSIWCMVPLTATTIFMVKFGFLAFFRPLVDHLPRLEAYWRVVVVITGFSYVFSVVDPFIACPKIIGLSSLSCSQKRATILGCTAIAADILTDVLLLGIPIYLLWKVQMRIKQKAGLGVFLCLSLVMVLTSVIRVSGYINHGLVDETWLVFWTLMESDVAVIMISLTAFRSIFLAKTIQRPYKEKHRGFLTFTRRKARNGAADAMKIRLTIPKPAMTGLTFIRGERSTNSASETVFTNPTHSTGPSTTLQSLGGDSIFDDSWRAEKRTYRYHCDPV